MKKKTESIKKNKKIKVIITPEFCKEHRCSSYASTTLVYQTKDKKETTDVSEALLDNLGRPIVLRRSAESCAPATSYFPKQTLTFNPKNPSARLIAMEARSFVNSELPPTDYSDKFEALSKCEKTISAFVNKYNSFINNPNTSDNGNS